MIAWHTELEAFYKRHNPLRVPDVDRALTTFTGLEEALWLALLRRYADDRRVTPRPLAGSQPGTARHRVIRFYARYRPSKLKQLSQVMDLVKTEGAPKVFELLTGQREYGPEPSGVPLSTRERMNILYATYFKLERLDALDALLERYKGMEEALLRRTVAELGQEPHVTELGDPRETRERLRRMFNMYHPESLRRVDLLLARYAGNEVQLFAMLQRQYGAEPTDRELALLRAREVEAAHDKESRDKAKQSAKQQGATAARLAQHQQMADIGGDNWDVGDVMDEAALPGGVQRPMPMLQLRDVLLHNGKLGARHYSSLVAAIFNLYDRSLLPRAGLLSAARYGNDEASELLAMLDYMYCNALPIDYVTSLRTTVSLLEMKHGNTLEEIWVAGGVEPFLARVQHAQQDTWCTYLAQQHGEVTEAALATVNRLRAFYHRYNPRKTVAEIDAVLATFGDDHDAIYIELQRTYGPEPPAIAVDMVRATAIVERNAPHLLPRLHDAVEAHCCVGDTAEGVLARMVRTYGQEPDAFDASLADFFATEFDGRYGVFLAELRLRGVLWRRHKQELNPNVDVLTSIITGVPTQWTDDNKKHDMTGQFDEAGAAATLLEREYDARQLLQDQQHIQFKQITDIYGGALDVWDQNSNVPLAEMLTRHLIVDDAMLVYPPLEAQMAAEAVDLRKWLKTRLVWRERWAADDAAREAKERREQEKQRVLSDVARAAPSAAAPNASASHQAIMQDFHDRIHEAGVKALQFNAAVAFERRKKQRVIESSIHPTRPLHKGCRFHGTGYTLPDTHRDPSAPPPEEEPVTTTDEDIPKPVVDWEAEFQQQCQEYVRALLQTHEPARLPAAGELLARHQGKEYQLIAALEQQYDVHHHAERALAARVQTFYSHVAPRKMEEVPTVLAKFAGKPEQLWPYLHARYGHDAEMRTPELRAYLVERLRNYVLRVEPQLFPQCEDMVDRCDDPNCVTLFARLAEGYGPEGEDAEAEDLVRDLRGFYRARGLQRALPRVETMARRFVGRRPLLNELLRRKFNASLDDVEKDMEQRRTAA
jgi:hypothetical protein